jgi:transcription elongation factor Elf1
MRTKPYTKVGIRRLKCFRCGNQASRQWQICSDGNQYRPICDRCDIELNELVLKFMGFDDWEQKIDSYYHMVMYTQQKEDCDVR